MNPTIHNQSLRFDALAAALDQIRALKPLLIRLGRQDPDLTRQIRRAAQSVALNLGEGRRRQGKDRRHLFRIAGGSVEELRTALWVVEASGYIDLGPFDLLDRLAAMTWRLGA